MRSLYSTSLSATRIASAPAGGRDGIAALMSRTGHPRAVSPRAGIEANGSICGPHARRCELFAEIDDDPTCIFWG